MGVIAWIVLGAGLLANMLILSRSQRSRRWAHR